MSAKAIMHKVRNCLLRNGIQTMYKSEIEKDTKREKPIDNNKDIIMMISSKMSI